MIGLPIAVDMPHSVSVTAAALLAAASLSAVTASPAFAAALAPRKPALPATLVVGLRSDAAAAGTVADLDADPDVRVLRSTVSTGLDAVTVTVPATDRGDAVAALRADPDVTYVENNGVATIDATSADPTYPQQWGLSRTKVPAAGDTTTGRADVVVAVVDTGVNAVSELAGRVLPG